MFDFLGLFYSFTVQLYGFAAPLPYVILHCTSMARYSLFVLKVPLNQTGLKMVDVLSSTVCTWLERVHYVNMQGVPLRQR